MSLGHYTEALRIYRELLAEGAESPELHLSMGHALKALGHPGEALAAYRAATLARPSFGEAYCSLAELEGYHFSHEEITRMWAQEASPSIGTRDRYHLCFALARALEERGEYELACRYFERGYRLKSAPALRF